MKNEDNKIDDDNSDMIHKLHEFIYLLLEILIQKWNLYQICTKWTEKHLLNTC